MDFSPILAIIVELLLQTQVAPRSPESVFPVSISAWFATIVTVFLVIEKFILAWRGGQRPVLDKISAAQVSFRDELHRVETDVKHRLDTLASTEERHRNDFRERITHDINGVGKRADEAQVEATRAGDAVLKMGDRMLKSELDRKYIHEKLEELRRENRRSRRAVRTSTEAILQAIEAARMPPAKPPVTGGPR